MPHMPPPRTPHPGPNETRARARAHTERAHGACRVRGRDGAGGRQPAAASSSQQPASSSQQQPAAASSSQQQPAASSSSSSSLSLRVRVSVVHARALSSAPRRRHGSSSAMASCSHSPECIASREGESSAVHRLMKSRASCLQLITKRRGAPPPWAPPPLHSLSSPPSCSLMCVEVPALLLAVDPAGI
jgi:hypothetical protein